MFFLIAKNINLGTKLGDTQIMFDSLLMLCILSGYVFPVFFRYVFLLSFVEPLVGTPRT